MKHPKILYILLSIGLLVSLKNRDLTSRKQTLKSNHQSPAFLKQGHVWAKAQLETMSLEQKIAQFFMVASWSNRNEEHQQEIEKLVREQGIGGIIYFQGDRQNLTASIKRMQKAAKVPLLIGMDAEWGVGMRLNGEERYPYAYTIGAANDSILAQQLAVMMAQECKALGIHINFAPVADVNSNPANPVIGFRAFAQDQQHTSRLVSAMVRGMEEEGVLTSIKHFPGHGDTDTDSHLELPQVSHSSDRFYSTEFAPFKAGIQAGASTVMIGHLSAPNLDDSGIPASLSKKIIGSVLRDSLKFKGLVVSDALNMKAVAGKYGAVEVVVKAFEAGNDILLFPENVSEAIEAIAAKVKSNSISENEINERCMKVLQAKYHVLHPKKSAKVFTKGEIEWAKRQTYEKALTLVKNDGLLPLVDQGKKTALVSIGIHTSPFREMSANFQVCDMYHFYSFEEAAERMAGKLEKYDVILTAIHSKSVLAAKQFSSPGNLNSWASILPQSSKNALVLFGHPGMLKSLEISNPFASIVLAYENNIYAQEATAQLVFGAIGANGKIPFEVSTLIPNYAGLEVKDASRLKYSQPEELGIDPKDLAKIDAVVKKGLDNKAFPGCQVLVAIEGKIIYRKNFGTVTYEDTTPIRNDHVYDIASVSKIVGSTAALMRLQTLGKFSLEHSVKDYIPELTGGSKVGDINLKKMMAHQAGFTPWIAFYKQTVNYAVPDYSIYSVNKREGFEVPVADKMWIRNDYENTIYKTILNTPLKANPTYEYSDLGYYFAKKIIEKQSGNRQDLFMYEHFYDPMGLKNMRYLPQLYFPLNRIVPTENDQTFRRQVVHGFVHDPGAAMLGGVGGHAGIFSNSCDLAAMMQLFLNKGKYANQQIINPEIIAQYTAMQFKGNRRGAGFDRPTNSRKEGPTCSLVSLESFGHSGFTGTFTWADPVYGINYVFLSNRVYPDATNRKITELNIRTEIQRLIYEAVINAQKKKKLN